MPEPRPRWCTSPALVLLSALGAVGLRADEPSVSASKTAAAAAAAAATPASPTPPGHTRFGLREDQGRWWLVPPEGGLRFSLGVCVVDQGAPRQQYDEARPSYAAWRHYPTPEAWATATCARLCGWGFTTLGGWGDYETLRGARDQSLWLTPVLSLGAEVGAPWFDLWDEAIVARMDAAARTKLEAFRGADRVLGYYTDNELGWWNAALWKLTLAQPAASGQRQRLLELLRADYRGDWAVLERDFEPAGAGNWEELAHAGTLTLRPGGGGVRSMRRFLALVAERYYALTSQAIRRHDPRALVLGDRYQSFYYPEVARASAAHVDVASTNLNANWNDGTFLRSYLDGLHAVTTKPVLASEFYLAARENRSGCPNSRGMFPRVDTQAQRAAAARTTLSELARLRYVVGADWFQYYDEPPHGRFDGEDYNFGLVDLEDRPYEALTRAFATLNPTDLHTQPFGARLDATAGVPPAPEEPLANPAFGSFLEAWDRRRGFVPCASETPLGDLYVCWTPAALYLGLYFLDIVETDYYRDGAVPEEDRALWQVDIGDLRAAVRLGAGRGAAVVNPQVQVASLPGSNHQVRNIGVLVAPAAALGRRELRPGDRIELRSTLDTHARAHRMAWQASLRLAKP